MNLIDVLLILIVALAMWSGWSKGFILGITDLAVWLGSLLLGFLFYDNTAVLVQKVAPSLGVWTLPLAFVFTLILARILLALLMYRFIRRSPSLAATSTANHVFGVIPGAVTGAIYAAVAAALLLSIPMWSGLSKEARESRIANRLGMQVAWLDEKFSPIFGEAAKETAVRMKIRPDEETEETVALHFTVDNPNVRPDLEAQMLQLVNQERTKRGLQPVKADPELSQVARAHSTDMFARGYFSHYTPERKDPFDRMKSAGVKFLAAGENLALGRTLKICHEGLMNSPGHRANILNGSFGRLGIGIMSTLR